MRAGPSALPSPGSWQLESVREQRGIWIGKSPCMLLGKKEAKGGEGSILQMLRPLGKRIFTERKKGWSVLLLGVKAGENRPSSSFQGACTHWNVQPSFSAGVAARVQPVPGWKECEHIVSTQRLPAKREQAAQGKKCKADWLQEWKQESFFCLSSILSWSVSLPSMWGALPRRCHLADRGLSHNNTFCSHPVCSPLAQSTGELTALL